MNKLPEGWRFRVNWRGQLILQIRRTLPHLDGLPGARIYIWEDARLTDINTILE